jgi:hypothetical protein
MISDVFATLTNIQGCIQKLLDELQSMKSLLEITSTKFPIYESIISSIQQSIDNIIKVNKYKIPNKHALKYDLIKILHMKLEDISGMLIMFKTWNTKMGIRNCCSFEKFVFLIRNPRPSSILQQLETAFSDLEPLITKLIDLEKNILGTAISIEHPILQKAWLMVGGNQLNETTIPIHIMVEHLYLMYSIENNDFVTNKDYIIKRITDFLKLFDGMASSVADGNLSIVEMNFLKPTTFNSHSVSEMVNITDKDIFENMFPFCREEMEKDYVLESTALKVMNIKIPIDLKENMYISYAGRRNIKEPLCVGYGADFNNTNACQFIISPDLLPNEHYRLFGIDVECNATDQGFGGTGQCHLRYQINDKVTVKAFQVDRDLFPDNIYKFSIPPDNIKIGDTVTLWIFSPGWNGWSMHLKSVHSSARFIPINAVQ